MAAPMRSFLRSVKPKYVEYLAKSISNYQKVVPICSPKVGSSFFTVIPRRSQCYEARNIDITSQQKGPLMFDTHLVVKSLQDGGFTTTQAEKVVETLVELSETKLDYMKKNMVTKAQQEIMHQQIMTHIGSVKKDMVILEKSEFSALKHEYEKQHIEIRQLREHFEDEVTKLKSGVTLDLNLEKSRAKEAHSDNSRALGDIRNMIEIERTQGQRDVSMLDNKIDKEIANLLATYERYRNDVIKYAAGTVMTCLTLCLGFFRLWS